MRQRGLFLLTLASTLALAAPAVAQQPQRDQQRQRIRDPSTHAAAETPDQQRDRIQLRDQLRTELQLTDPEIAALDRELPLYLQRGDRERVRQTIRDTVHDGCRGPCLGVTLRYMNRAMQHGLTDGEAQEFCQNNVREQLRERAGLNDEEIAARLDQRMQRQLQGTMRKGDRARDRIHQPGRDRGPGGRGPGGSQRGGGGQ